MEKGWASRRVARVRRLAGAERDKLDLDHGTLAIETTRVVVNCKVIESDGKTENAQTGQLIMPGMASGLGFVGWERVTRIELALSAWEADVLPLNYTRVPRQPSR
jgi:hypothetical protein